MVAATRSSATLLALAAFVSGCAGPLSESPPSGSNDPSPAASSPAGSPATVWTPANKEWISPESSGEYVAYSTGLNKRFQVPEDFVGIAAGFGSVAYARYQESDGKSIVAVASIESGTEYVSFELEGSVSGAALSPTHLFLTGTSGESGERDIGVVAVDITSGEPSTVVEGGPMPDAIAGYYGARGPISMSPSGQVIGAQLCSAAEICSVDVLDTMTRELIGRVDLPSETFLLGLTEEVVVARNAREMVGVDAEGGTTIWRIEKPALASPIPGYVVEDGVVAVYLDEGTSNSTMALVNIEDGTMRWSIALSGNDFAPWPEVSDADFLVLGRESMSLADSISAGSTGDALLVDLAARTQLSISLALP